MFRIYCTLEGMDADNVFAFSFDSPRDLVTYLRKLGKGQLKRQKIDKILRVVEGL